MLKTVVDKTIIEKKLDSIAIERKEEGIDCHFQTKDSLYIRIDENEQNVHIVYHNYKDDECPSKFAVLTVDEFLQNILKLAEKHEVKE
jgi:hypothetical protein